MTHSLTGKKIIILVSNGVDEAVMSTVQRELLKTGALLKTVGTEPGLVNSWNGTDNVWGFYFPVDQPLSQTLGSDFDFMIVPSGARGVAKLAASPHADRIISGFASAGKPMAFMGDAADLLSKGGHAETPAVLRAGGVESIPEIIAHFTGADYEVKAAA